MTAREELKEIAREGETYAERRAEIILRAKAEGMTWAEIAAVLGMKSEHGAIKASRAAHP